MPLYEKFNLDARLFADEELEWQKRAISQALSHTEEPTLLWGRKWSAVSDSDLMCFQYYLTDRRHEIPQYARPMLDYAIEYFFGDWRSVVPTDDGKLDAAWWKQGAWVGQFRASILWGTCLGEWKMVREISMYPTEECMLNNLEPRETKAWYMILAIFLREMSLDNADKYISLVEGGKQKRAKILLSVLRTIVSRDSEAFAREFAAYMKYYKAREYSIPQITEKLAIDGTILFNVARHLGMNVEWPDKYMDHYISLRTQ
jgi:hypothetical protein